MMTKTQLPSLPPCPRCGSELFDNRSDRASSKSPIARCSNVGCLDGKGKRSAWWKIEDIGPAKGSAAPKPAPAAAPAPADPNERLTQIARVHMKALRLVVEHELPLLKSLPGDVAGAVAAMAATITIEYHKTNGGHK